MPFYSESDLQWGISLLISCPEIGSDDQSIFLWLCYLGITVPFNITIVFHQEAAKSLRLSTNPCFLTVKSFINTFGVKCLKNQDMVCLEFWKTDQLLVSFCDICQVTFVKEPTSDLYIAEPWIYNLKTCVVLYCISCTILLYCTDNKGMKTKSPPQVETEEFH